MKSNNSLTPAKKTFRKVKQKSISKLKHEADKWVSRWVRQSAADRNGSASCYTCGNTAPWKALQCGHHIPRNISATRYDLDNLRVQDAGCNIWGGGKQHIFADKLLEEIGVERYKALLARGRQTHQFTRKELEGIISDFREKVKELEQ